MTVPVGSGISGQYGFAQEVTVGTATVAGMRFLEADGDGLKQTKKTVQGKGLHAGGLYLRTGRRAYTTREATGDVTMDVTTNGFGLIFQHMLGSFGSLFTNTQVGVTPAWTQVHRPGSLKGKALTIQKGAPTNAAVVEPITYTGCKITDWELSCKVDDLVKLKLTVDSMDELSADSASWPQGVAGPALAVASYLNSRVLHFAEGHIYHGGTVVVSGGGVASITTPVELTTVSEVTLKGSNKMKTDRWFLGSGGRKKEPIENDFREISGSFTAEFEDRTMYNKFGRDTVDPMRLLFTDPFDEGGGSHSFLEIIVPSVPLNSGSPSVDGPDVLKMQYDFDGLDPQTTASPIQFTYQTTDTAV